MKEHVQAAYHVVQTTPYDAAVAAEALDRAGLLRTGLEKRAIEACEDAAAAYPGNLDKYCEPGRTCVVVGRESLAAKKPKERWTVDSEFPPQNGCHAVRDRNTDRRVAWFTERSDAAAYAVQKNESQP